MAATVIAPADRVGLAVAEMQTFHLGHAALLNEMQMNCGTRIVALGSKRQFGVAGHPFTFEQRRAMITAVFGDRFHFVALDDIDASEDMRDWYRYVQNKIEAAGLPAPTDYFGGSLIDARWYTHAFADPDYPATERWGAAGTLRFRRTDGHQLHVVDREAGKLPSGREVRSAIEMRHGSWKDFVPAMIHDFVERQYPPHLRQPVKIEDLLRRADLRDYLSCGFDRFMEDCDLHFPVGTRLVGASLPEVLELKDDGRWRPLPKRDEKAEWAKENG